MLKVFKEMVKQAEEAYKTVTESAIKATIRSSFLYDVDDEVTSYYAEVYSDKILDEMTDEEYFKVKDEQATKRSNLNLEMENCMDALYELVTEIDDWAEVSKSYFEDGSVEFKVKVDGMSFEFTLENRLE